MKTLSALLLAANLLACVDDPEIAGESELTSDLQFSPCFFATYQLSQIAQQAAGTLQMNGAAGWSVVAMRRVQDTTCVGSSSGGFAKSTADGYQPMTADTQSPIASNSKVITAVALTKILADHGISRTAKIGPWLPPGWIQGPGVANLTFRDLLTHKTGLFIDGNSGLSGGWGADLVADMKLWLMLGVVEAPVFDYANSHMLLLQLLGARIQYGSLVYTMGGAMFVFAGQLLETYVRSELFIPHDIGTTAPVPACSYDRNAIRAYTVNAPTSQVGLELAGSDHAHCGMGFWNISPRNFTLFLERLYNEDLLGPTLTSEYETFGYGWDPSPAEYFAKSGNIPGGSKQFKSRGFVFDDGTVVMAQINSNSDIGPAVVDAYNAVMP